MCDRLERVTADHQRAIKELLQLLTIVIGQPPQEKPTEVRAQGAN